MVMRLLGTRVLDDLDHLIRGHFLYLLVKFNRIGITHVLVRALNWLSIEAFLQGVELLVQLEVLHAVRILLLLARCVCLLRRANFGLRRDDLLLRLILLQGRSRRRLREAVVDSELVLSLDLSRGSLRGQGRNERVARIPVIQFPLFGHLLLLAVREHLLTAGSLVRRR